MKNLKNLKNFEKKIRTFFRFFWSLSFRLSPRASIPCIHKIVVERSVDGRNAETDRCTAWSTCLWCGSIIPEGGAPHVGRDPRSGSLEIPYQLWKIPYQLWSWHGMSGDRYGWSGGPRAANAPGRSGGWPRDGLDVTGDVQRLGSNRTGLHVNLVI